MHKVREENNHQKNKWNHLNPILLYYCGCVWSKKKFIPFDLWMHISILIIYSIDFLIQINDYSLGLQWIFKNWFQMVVSCNLCPVFVSLQLHWQQNVTHFLPSQGTTTFFYIPPYPGIIISKATSRNISQGVDTRHLSRPQRNI